MTDSDFSLAEQEKVVGALLDRLLPQLMEHCDSVQVITTKTDGNGTTYKSVRGEGNYYARLAACREWLEEDKVRVRFQVIQQNREDEED